MKKVIILLMMFVILLSSYSQAATKQDVINAINAYYQVGDTNFRLPQKYINKGEAYLNSHPLTSEQYSKILGCINSAVAYAREIGHVRYKEYTKEQINKGLSYVLAACKYAEVDMKSEMSKDSSNDSSNNSSSEDLHKVETQTSSNNGNAQKTATVEVNNNTSDKTSQSPSEVVKETVGDDVSTSISGEASTSGENNMAVSLSGEAIQDIANFEETIEKIKYTEDDLDKRVNRKLFFIYLVVFSILLVNILLIRLLFKKKWNKIFKTILIVVLSIITLAILITALISIYYIEELKIIYELYYLLY